MSSRSRTPPAATTCAGCRRSSTSTRRCSIRSTATSARWRSISRIPWGVRRFSAWRQPPTWSSESFRPGVMDRLGIGFAALREVNPRLVLCSISGYGQDGPFRDRAGHDLNYAAVAGVLLLGGSAERRSGDAGPAGGRPRRRRARRRARDHDRAASRGAHRPGSALRRLDGRRSDQLGGRARIAALRHRRATGTGWRDADRRGIPATGSTRAPTGTSPSARSSPSSGASSSR